MNKFRRPPTTPEDFVRGAATARDLLPQDDTPAMTPVPTPQAARASEPKAALELPQEPQKPKQKPREAELIFNPAEALEKPSKTRITKLTAFTMPEAPPELSARVQKQINFDMPETEHWVLKQLVDRTPAMSLRKFYLAAVREKMEQMLSDEQAKGIGKGS